MTVTTKAADAQRAAMAVVQAQRLRTVWGDEVLHDTIRDTAAEHSPARMISHLAALVPAMAAIAELRIRDLLRDPELLRAATLAAVAGYPLEPAVLALSADDLMDLAADCAATVTGDD